jgi:hypothetical protein
MLLILLSHAHVKSRGLPADIANNANILIGRCYNPVFLGQRILAE